MCTTVGPQWHSIRCAVTPLKTVSVSKNRKPTVFGTVPSKHFSLTSKFDWKTCFCGMTSDAAAWEVGPGPKLGVFPTWKFQVVNWYFNSPHRVDLPPASRNDIILWHKINCRAKKVVDFPILVDQRKMSNETDNLNYTHMLPYDFHHQIISKSFVSNSCFERCALNLPHGGLDSFASPKHKPTHDRSVTPIVHPKSCSGFGFSNRLPGHSLSLLTSRAILDQSCH